MVTYVEKANLVGENRTELSVRGDTLLDIIQLQRSSCRGYVVIEYIANHSVIEKHMD